MRTPPARAQVRPPQALGLLAVLALLATSMAPPGQALPPGCDPPGCVGAHLLGYVPPLTVVRAGEPLRWQAIDVLHTSTEQDLLAGAAEPCFDAWYGLAPSAPVRFRVDGGAVAAREGAGVERPCTMAQALPGGGAAVPYYCALHPSMRGAILVLP